MIESMKMNSCLKMIFEKAGAAPRLVKLGALMLALVPLAEKAQALPYIEGTIGFFDTGATPINSAGTQVPIIDATGLSFANPVSTFMATGDFAGLAGANNATINTFQFDPLSPSPVDPLWEAGGFKFVLTSVSVDVHSANQLNLSGTGVIKNAGFEDTVGTWRFGGGGSTKFTFFAGTTAIPDGGSSVLLIGLALGSLCAGRRFLQQA